MLNNQKNKNIFSMKKLGFMAGAMFLMPAFAMAASCPIKPEERVNVKWYPGHYQFIAGKNVDTQLNNFLGNFKSVPAMKGIQKEYFWSDLEPTKGVYDFSKIDADIAKLAAFNKKLAITIKYKYQKGPGDSSLPNYILNLPKVTVGGIANVPPYFEQGKPGDGEGNVGQHANLGHPGTQAALKKLLNALAEKYDGNKNFASLTFLETSLGADTSAAIHDLFLDGVMKAEAHAGCVFEHTPIFQNLNFPRNKLPEFTANMKKYGIGLGGPDVFWGSFDKVEPDGRILNGLAFRGKPGYPYPGVYWYYPDMAKTVPIGQQAHYENFKYDTREAMLPEPGKPHYLSAAISVDKIYDFTVDRLKANYMFWQVYGSELDVLENRLKSSAGLPLSTTCPAIYGGKCNALSGGSGTTAPATAR